jgi:Tfp pilus assembly protein PilO
MGKGIKIVISLVVVLVIAVLIATWIFGIRNKMVDLEEKVSSSWAQVQNQYQRCPLSGSTSRIRSSVAKVVSCD